MHREEKGSLYSQNRFPRLKLKKRGVGGSAGSEKYRNGVKKTHK